MRKNTKFLAVLSSAAMMSAVTPGLASAIPSFVSTAFAASAGWVDEDGSLRYKDSDGYYLTDSWKKRDNEWYYLNEDGYISRSEKIDEYYVDEEGKRVLNTWIVEENEDSWGDDEPENFWYYYGKDGKNVTAKWQSIEGKDYYFNEDGYMETGKITLDGFTYYLGEEGDGAMKKGWIQLENEDENAEETMVWHFFDSKGRMIMNEVDRKISGAYYTFENGVMQTGWYKLPGNAAAAESDTTELSATASNADSAELPNDSFAAAAPAIASYQYYDTDGKRANGWYTIEGIEGIHDDSDEFTFYFKDGKPYYAQTGIQIFVIDAKRYGFNTRGERQTDLQTVTLEDGITTATCYFGEDGVVRTGKQTIYNEDLGENQTWFFLTDGINKGQGFHGIRDNSVYNQGLRLDADRDLRYAPVSIQDVRYLVNTSGVIQKATSSSKSTAKPELGSGYKDIKDSNDNVWTVDTNGIIQE
jgi:glucan-binding YG repeat protein